MRNDIFIIPIIIITDKLFTSVTTYKINNIYFYFIDFCYYFFRFHTSIIPFFNIKSRFIPEKFSSCSSTSPHNTLSTFPHYITQTTHFQSKLAPRKAATSFYYNIPQYPSERITNSQIRPIFTKQAKTNHIRSIGL